MGWGHDLAWCLSDVRTAPGHFLDKSKHTNLKMLAVNNTCWHLQAYSEISAVPQADGAAWNTLPMRLLLSFFKPGNTNVSD